MGDGCNCCDPGPWVAQAAGKGEAHGGPILQRWEGVMETPRAWSTLQQAANCSVEALLCPSVPTPLARSRLDTWDSGLSPRNSSQPRAQPLQGAACCLGKGLPSGLASWGSWGPAWPQLGYPLLALDPGNQSTDWSSPRAALSSERAQAELVLAFPPHPYAPAPVSVPRSLWCAENLAPGL